MKTKRLLQTALILIIAVMSARGVTDDIVVSNDNQISTQIEASKNQGETSKSLCELVAIASDGWHSMQDDDQWPISGRHIGLGSIGPRLEGSHSCRDDSLTTLRSELPGYPIGT